MKERVITAMWGDAWQRYGEKFVRSFERYWHPGVELWIVTDYPLPTERAVQFPLFDVPGYADFMNQWRDHPEKQGLRSADPKARPGERFWKHDAVKWAPQALAAAVGLDGLEDGDLLAWFDADVETIEAPPLHWLNILLEGKDLATLFRDRQHPEIGYWGIRSTPATRAAIREFARIYVNGRVFDLPEWHSAYAFQHAIRAIPDARIANANPSMMRGHCWPRSRLARYTRHNKGKLKDQ